ncbi:TetR/AcrR family transcriptional regulator [Microbacterium sp. Bi128]|uniref:TetR/AcrR family transcriptional regulator n=1 Tax=Microbacterium sp. Bi128 TaxID=2821115 RepID=UPI001D52867E|nr:TetR/AcrR family transcriptional regulator [Microbacterium sp. Bi128]CAH0312618.1 HTH-type transcriptional regulator RutR [Microbacterium sp. Bi128]
MADDATIGRPGQRRRGVERRQEILDRAIEVFRQRGADGTSLRRIAESIGVSHAALLHYFDSREQLLVAVYDHAAAKRAEEEAAHPVEPGVEGMIAAATANVEVPGLVQLYSTLVAAALEVDSGVGKEYFTSRFERLRAELGEIFRAQQAEGRIRDDVSADHLAALLIAASDGLQIQWLLDASVGLSDTLRTFAMLLQPPRAG